MTPQGGLDAKARFYRCFNSALLSTVSEHRGFGVAQILLAFCRRGSDLRPRRRTAVIGDAWTQVAFFWITLQLPFSPVHQPPALQREYPSDALCTQMQIGTSWKCFVLFFSNEVACWINGFSSCLSNHFSLWITFSNPPPLVSPPVFFQIADRKCLERQRTWRFLAESSTFF